MICSPSTYAFLVLQWQLRTVHARRRAGTARSRVARPARDLPRAPARRVTQISTDPRLQVDPIGRHARAKPSSVSPNPAGRPPSLPQKRYRALPGRRFRASWSVHPFAGADRRCPPSVGNRPVTWRNVAASSLLSGSHAGCSAGEPLDQSSARHPCCHLHGRTTKVRARSCGYFRGRPEGPIAGPFGPTTAEPSQGSLSLPR